MLEIRKPISVGEAIARVQAEARRLESEIVPLEDSYGRILARPLVAVHDVPPFDRSPYDGYAIRARDSAGASGGNRIGFTVIDHIGAGAVSAKRLGPNQAVRIMTGAQLPAGADAVVMLEQAQEGAPKPEEKALLSVSSTPETAATLDAFSMPEAGALLSVSSTSARAAMLGVSSTSVSSTSEVAPLLGVTLPAKAAAPPGVSSPRGTSTLLKASLLEASLTGASSSGASLSPGTASLPETVMPTLPAAPGIFTIRKTFVSGENIS